MSAARWVFLTATCLGGAVAVGACGSFASTTSGETDAGAEASPPVVDASTDGAPPADAQPADAQGDASDALDASDASDGATTCPGKDLASDKDNCGACGRQCSPYSPTCVAGECEHLVFVTQAALSGNLGGLDAADAYCTTVAANSGSSRGNAPFKAWLSTSTVNAASRFVHGNRRYVDKIPMTIAADWNALVSGVLERGIFLSEAGNSLTGVPVRTATSTLGVFVGPSDCAAWTNTGSSTMNAFGLSAATDSTWTQSGSTQTCLVSAHLYCIEQ
jgi:hypothetical protein